MAEQDFRHIVRIANTDVKGEKHIMYALRKIKGVSVMMAHAVCIAAGVDTKKRAGDLSQTEVDHLTEVVVNPKKYGLPEWLFNRRWDPETAETGHLIGPDLIFAQDNDVKRMKKIKSYKGLRHQWGLPVRGQRTKSNFRKNKGKATGVAKKKKE
ncbi:MAG: 30S ribosomal protein S13 [Nanoarchaeota archaeon]